MNKDNIIHPNKFSEFHNGETIFFCKIDFIWDDYQTISQLKNNVVLILGNSDTPFTEHLLKLKPNNIKHIFSSNSMVINDLVTPIPVGIENFTECLRPGHGIINEEVFPKIPFIFKEKIVDPKPNKIDKLYGNFNVETNPYYRSLVRGICATSDNIDFEVGLTYEEYVYKIKSYIGTISPEGNGMECIRTFEVLYLDEYPICVGEYPKYHAIYEGIYKYLPIVFVTNPSDLKNHLKIKSELNKVKKNNKESLYFDFWKEKIKKKIKEVI